MRLIPYAVVALALLAVLSGCGDSGEPGASSAVPSDAVVAFDTIIGSESGWLGMVSSIDVSPEGGLWLADRINHRLVVVRPDGELETIGREGSGPGEFRAPTGVGIGEVGVDVYDLGNGRLQRLSFSGELLRSDPVSDGFPFPVAMNGGGMLVGGTMGRYSGLAAVVGPSVAEGRRLRGTPRAPDVLEMSLARMRAQAMEGEVPVEFRNSVVPIVGLDGGLWLVVQGDAVVEHFDADGVLRWEKPLTGPEIDAAFQRFFSAWEGPVGLTSVPFPWIVRWGVLSGDNLWLMMDASEGKGSVILVLDARTGTPMRKIHLSTDQRVGPFAVDEQRERLYLVTPDDAALISAALPTR